MFFTAHKKLTARVLAVAAAGASLLGCGSAPEAATESNEPLTVTASQDGTDDRAEHGGAGARADAAPLVCGNTSLPRPSSDNGYRVQIYTGVNSTPAGTRFPAPSQSWTVEYKFTTPPLPCSSTWNYENQTFYIWGDLVFDEYGSSGPYPLSSYRFNQIVPQLMIGNTLNGSATGYGGTGVAYPTWVIEAQYFWLNTSNEYFVQAGKPVGVKPGDKITTKIAYRASTGSITASISAPEGTSSIVIPAPFPNESPLLFSSWRAFFEQASAKSHGLTAQPQLNVESHFVDQTTLCGLLPWTINDIVVPNVRAVSSNYQSAKVGSYSCPTAIDSLKFCSIPLVVDRARATLRNCGVRGHCHCHVPGRLVTPGGVCPTPRGPPFEPSRPWRFTRALRACQAEPLLTEVYPTLGAAARGRLRRSTRHARRYDSPL